MSKVVISVIGSDRPGIVAAVSQVLFQNRCNIEDVSQTILQAEFAGIFIASIPPDLVLETLLAELRRRLDPMGLSVIAKSVETQKAWAAPPGEPFVITTIGPDRLGLVAGITEIMARFGVNITYLKAAFRGGDDPHRNTMIYEVDIPATIDQSAFRQALRRRAEDMGLELSLQHRDIFEAIHRV